jgi:CSLREA domain-containing protein
MLTHLKWMRVALSLSLAMFLFGQSVVKAQVGVTATFFVNSTADAADETPGDGLCRTTAGDCTLRAALQEANMLTGMDEIVLPQGTYTVNSTLTINSTVTVRNDTNAGAEPVLDANGSARIFDVQPGGNATLSGLTLRESSGLGSMRNQAVLTLRDSAIIQGNGSGIVNGGTLAVINSTISGNIGVGLVNNSGTANVRNATIADNTTPTMNGAGGIEHNGGTVTLRNSVLSGGRDDSDNARDCAGTLTLEESNLIQTVSNCTLTGNIAGLLAGAGAQLGMAQNNGGPSHTRALLPGSPAIDAGNNCEPNDQRGVSRVQGARCDLGAFEVPVVRFSAVSYPIVENAGNATVMAQVQTAIPFNININYATADGSAQAGTDYTPTSGTLALRNSANISIPVINRPLYNGNRTFSVTLTPGAGVGVGAPSTTTVTITDDEPPVLYLPLVTRDFRSFYTQACETEVNDSPSQANGPIQSGRNYCGTNDGSGDDRDYFSFTANTGGINVGVTNLSGGAQVHLFYQDTNNRVGFSASPPFQVQYSGQPGVYYIMIYTPPSYTGGQYTLTATFP